MKNYVELFFSLNKDAIERVKTRRKIVKVGIGIISLALSICITVCIMVLLHTLLDNPLPKNLVDVSVVLKKCVFTSSLLALSFCTLIACFFSLIFMVFPSSIINYFLKKNNLEVIAQEFIIKTIGKDLIDAINEKFSSDLVINEPFKKALDEYWWLDNDFTLESVIKVKVTDSNLKFNYEEKEFTLKKWKYSKKGFRAIFDIRHPDGVIEKNISFELPEV